MGSVGTPLQPCWVSLELTTQTQAVWALDFLMSHTSAYPLSTV